MVDAVYNPKIAAKVAPTDNVGLKHSGFVRGAKEGPLHCKNCVFFMNVDHSECWHPEVIEDAKGKNKYNLKLDDDGHALVEPEDCCDYHRKGKTITQAKADRLMGAVKLMGGKK